MMRGLVAVIIVLFFLTVRVVNQYERKVVLTLGKFTRVLKPGINFIVPILEKTISIDIREKAVDIPSQEAITRDNISCIVNAVIYYKVREDQVEKSVLNVMYLDYAMSQFALTTMRNIVGQFDLDELLSKRDEAAEKIMAIVDAKSNDWGVEILSVELKDINIPDDLKRTIGKQAEAEREKRAKIITSEGELRSAENLKKAAETLASAPGALHLRTLQSVNDISSDPSNTTVWMIPMDVLGAIKGFDKGAGKKVGEVTSHVSRKRSISTDEVREIENGDDDIKVVNHTPKFSARKGKAL